MSKKSLKAAFETEVDVETFVPWEPKTESIGSNHFVQLEDGSLFPANAAQTLSLSLPAIFKTRLSMYARYTRQPMVKVIMDAVEAKLKEEAEKFS